jgi:hypothetical protein
MKKIIYSLAIIAVIIGIYEETKPTPNKFIMLGCMLFLFFGLYQLMKKIPSKNQDEDNEETV